MKRFLGMAVIFATLCLFGVSMERIHRAEAQVVEPNNEQFEICGVKAVNEDIIWNKRTCDVYVIRCPISGGSCKAWPVEYVEIEE